MTGHKKAAEQEEKIEEKVPPKDELTLLKEKLEAKDLAIADLTDTAKRVQAEFINYKKRAERESRVCAEYTNELLMKSLLPILDSFDQALKQKENKEEIVKGLELLHAQLLNLLKHEGLTPISAIGEKFDPYKHEVMQKEKSDKESDTIVDEIQKGYIFKDKVLRHSMVKIAE